MAAITSAGRAVGLEPLELAGDSRAAAALYERHSSRVFGYCLSRLGRREDAEDAVQTTFLHAVRGLRRGIVPAVEVAWLLGIAHNVCLSRWETAGRRSRLESPCDPLELDRGTAAPQGRRDELIGLEDALAKLPDQQRRAVLLRDWRGLSYEEVAEQLGVSHAAVETLIFRGRRTLAELLREEPQATRRRLRSLGDLGSLFTAVKTTFAGGAAVTKIAVAAVAAVAISGAGVAVGTSLQGERPVPLQPLDAKPASPVAPLVSNAPKHPSLPAPAPVQPVRGTRSGAPPAVAAKPATRTSIAPTPSAPAAHTATVPDTTGPGPDVAASAEGVAHRRQAQPTPVVAVPPARAVLPAVTTAVEKTVDTLLPNLPVEVPPLPVLPALLPDLPATAPVTDVVASVPAIVANPPVTVTLPPVEVSPPKLLP